MRSVAAATLLLFCCAGSAAAASGQAAFHDRRLDEVLRALQRGGLPIVFSSEIVTPDLRVIAEPRATAPRAQLDELLEPHGLRAERGPGGVLQVVRVRSAPAVGSARSSAVSATRGTRGATTDSTRAARTYTERVVVTGSQATRADRGASQVSFDRRDLQSGGSTLQDDGLRAVQAMPRVASLDDFRTEFSVRGSPYRHVGIVIDGVATSWLQHAVSSQRDGGSLSMFGSGILERATLQVGAYPRRYDDTLGGQLELTFREGSREATHLSGSAGGMSAAFVGEGPLGAGARGSWIASVRNSYRSWPPRPLTQNNVGFAFADAHAKLVFDVTAAHQVTVTTVGGRSALDSPDEPLAGSLGAGTNDAALFTIEWRAALRSRTVIRQRLSFAGQELLSTGAAGQAVPRMSNRSLAYRAEALRALFGGTIEAGGEVRQVSGARDQFDATWSTRSVYANFGRTIARGVSVAGGLRASESTLVQDRAIAPWLIGAWSLNRGWTVRASAGASRQFPELDALRGATGRSDLAPERARHIDIGVEQRVGHAFRWEATWFHRAESDVIFEPSTSGRYENALSGTSKGVELFVRRQDSARLSGWLSYAYSATRQTDGRANEPFWGDFDRRHALSATGVFRIAKDTSVGVVFRGASGVPVPGYFAVEGGTLVVGERRNDVRLPPYARFDVRMQRTFVFSRRRVSVFAEMLNVLNRRNEGPAHGVVHPLTGEATGFSRRLMPRRGSLGIEITLSR